ncbi:MAG: hypothetical protein KUG75_13980 [Pseudomonadales bacterium]|nr:hypothetical protein [Pseudomonadales bacterium]
MASVALQTATALEPVAKPRESKLVIWSMAMCMLCILPLFFDKDSFSYTSNQQDGAYVHMLLEWTGVCMAAMATFMCFVQYRLSRDTFLPLIGIVLLCSGLMDAFHILAAAHLLNTQVADQDLIPFTWALTRMFNATLILIGVAVLTLKSRQQSKELRTKTFFFVSAFFLLAAFLVMDAVVSAEYLPQTLFPDEIITRPYEWLAISIILLTEIIAIPLYVKGNNSVFGAALLLLLIPSLGAELWMVFASSQLYDNAFNVAHGLKAISYIIPLLGITSAYLKSSRDQNKLSAKLKLKNEELEDQSEQLHRVSVGESFLAEFGASLNQIDETLTYYKVLSNISNLLNAPVTALYVEQEGEMVLAAIVGSDPTLEPSAETGTGLVDRVYQSRQASIIAGPFDDKNFSFSVGVGAIQFYSISAWPILYFKKCVAVLVSYNQRAVVDDEEKLLLRCLDLLAIRVINFRSEKQRNELLSDLKSERTALEISSAEAKKANQVKTDFLARMSHEL